MAHASVFLPPRRRQQHQQRPHHLVDFQTLPSTSQLESNRRGTADSAGLSRQLSVVKLDPTGLWDLALREDPVPVYTSAESGEPDIEFKLT